MKSIGHDLVIMLIAIIGIGAYRNTQDTLYTTVDNNFVVDTLAKELTVPWSIVHLPDQTILFSERNGKIRLLRKQQLLPKAALTVKQIDTTKKMGRLVACLRGEAILRLQLQKDKVITQEYLFHHQYGRIRALSIGPDVIFIFLLLKMILLKVNPGRDMI